MGLSASEAMAVEDTEHGLKAAVAAGLRCVAIPTAQSETHDFSAASAQYSNLSDWVRAEIDCL
jgi:beta-phosphoglucomutase-like phosphatase (HAD superfamily)